MDWQARNDRARIADQKALDDRLTELEGNLAETLGMSLLVTGLTQFISRFSDIQHNNMMAMMVSLQHQLDNQPLNNRESRFFARSLQYLCTVSGSQVILEDWMVSAFDVDFGPKIGEGGL